MRANKLKLILIFSIIILFSSINIIPLIDGDIQKNKNVLDQILLNPCIMSNNSLLAYWNFDEGSGSIAHDYSGHGLDGIIHGTTWTNGYLGYALNFDGEEDYVLLDSHIDELGFNKTDDYKISAWIKTDTNNTGVIYMLSDLWTGIPVFYLKIIENGKIEISVSSSETCGLTVTSETMYNNSIWHFIEGIYHGSEVYPELELYIDNEFVASVSDWLCELGSNDFKAGKIGMASYDSLDMYEGIIDEVKVNKKPEGNIPPPPPVISGVTSGIVGEEYIYNFILTDLEGDELYLWVDWGDNTNTDWIGPYNTGKEVELNHTWIINGAYEIKAITKDTFDVGEPSILLIVMGNIAPDKPKIRGQTNVNKDELIEYTFNSTDLNNHNVKYYIDWGDGKTEWTDYYPSGEKVKIKHSWSKTGIYNITSKAKDSLDSESELSDPYAITITEKTFIVGLISNYSSCEDFLTVIPKMLMYMSLEPINTKIISSQDKILISNDYLGKISDKFIFGIFNSAIL